MTRQLALNFCTTLITDKLEKKTIFFLSNFHFIFFSRVIDLREKVQKRGVKIAKMTLKLDEN